MIRRLRSTFAALPVALLLAGCGTAGVPILMSTPPDLTGNWQIQSGSSTTATSVAGVLLLGSLASTGPKITGTFRLTTLALAGCLNQVVTVSGSIDTNRTLTLTSAPVAGSVVQITLTVPPLPTTIGAGTIQVTGGPCAFASSPAIGGLIAPVTGTYAGPLSVGPISTSPPPPTATGTLLLTQSTTPSPDGQFPLVGTLQFVSGTCAPSTQLTGTVSGVGITLSAASTLPLSLTNLIATVIPTASQVSVGFILFAPAPCSTSALSSATYSATLTRQ